MILFGFFGMSPTFAFAETIIQNSVSADANSGGNTASSGEVIEGASAVDIEVQTTVNGEVLEDVQKHIESSTGEPIEYSYQNTESSSEANAEAVTTTHVEAQVNSSFEERPEVSEEERVAAQAHTDVSNDFSITTFIKKLFSYVFGLF